MSKLDELQIITNLGSGANGTVYHAIDKNTKVHYVIKLLYKNRVKSYKYHNELLLKNLNHPNIIKIEDYEDTPKKFVIFYKYI